MYSLGTLSLRAYDQSMFLMSESSSSTPYPSAYSPPTRPPMLVPRTMSMGMSMDSRYLRTPTWAAPLAPPPLSTRATVGLCFLISAILALISSIARVSAAVRRALSGASPSDASAASSLASPAAPARRTAPDNSMHSSNMHFNPFISRCVFLQAFRMQPGCLHPWMPGLWPLCRPCPDGP